MKLRKCEEHGYTLEKKCKECGKETKEAHYKFIKIKSVRESLRKFNFNSTDPPSNYII